MDKWTEVVTDPLGLAGFTLFLVFSLFARRYRKVRSHWLAPTFFIMALVTLAATLYIAYVQHISQRTERAEKPPALSIEQETHGSQSSAVADVEGNVVIIQKNEPEKENQ
jgi:anti-sigma-K factor RskA